MTNEITKERRDAIRALIEKRAKDAADEQRDPRNSAKETWMWHCVEDELREVLKGIDALDAAEAKMGEPVAWRWRDDHHYWCTEDADMADRKSKTGFHAIPLYAAPPAAEPVIPTHRHKKRGSEYVLIGYGKMQAVGWWTRQVDHHGAASAADVDMREVAIYRSVDGGELWVRPREEFEDGRFEALSADTARIVASCAVPNGWVLVPRDPTQQMEAAAKAFVRPYHDISEID